VDHNENLPVPALKPNSFIRTQSKGVPVRPQIETGLQRRWIPDRGNRDGLANLSPKEPLDLHPGGRSRHRNSVGMCCDPPKHRIGGAERLAGRVTGLDCGASVLGDGFEDFRLHAPVVVSEGEPAELHRIMDAFELFESSLLIKGMILCSHEPTTFEPLNASC